MNGTMMKRMRNKVLGAALLASFGLTAAAWAAQDAAIPDAQLGLSKTSVYEVPSPDAVNWDAKDAGTVGKRAPRSYNTAPPMVPHNIEDFIPITLESNMCKDCHMLPDMIGQKIEPGMAVPLPTSHYTDVQAGELYMGRWNCTQCHRPQANVKPLVANVFGKRATKPARR